MPVWLQPFPLSVPDRLSQREAFPHSLVDTSAEGGEAIEDPETARSKSKEQIGGLGHCTDSLSGRFCLHPAKF